MSVSNRDRFLILRRDGFRCVYCGRTAGEAELHIDHVEPKAKGGANSIDNYVTACIVCNYGKGTRSIMPDKSDKPAPPPVRQEPPAASPGLSGKCFVIIGADYQPERQGVIRQEVAEGVYLIQFFDWFAGEPNTMQLVPIEEMLSTPDNERAPGAWIFFEDDAHLKAWLNTWGKKHRASGEGGNA